MYPGPEDRDTAEIRLLRAIYDLNNRIPATASEEERTNLRGSIVALRSELLKLIESMPIFSEADVSRIRIGMGNGPAALTLRGCS
jgi:hypothetical protein